jgi:hypothetical protein
MQQLVHLNIGRLLGGHDDPRMVDFFAQLETINGLAEASVGYVWRLTEEEMGASAMVWPGDETVVGTLSVWASVESLEKFVWQSAHATAYARKREWFQKMKGPAFVMWWIPAGHKPTLADGKARLEYLVEFGPSDHAFGWEHMAAAKLWQEKRCA